MEFRFVRGGERKRGRTAIADIPSRDPKSIERRKAAIANWAQRDPLNPRRARSPAAKRLPPEPIDPADGLPTSFCGAFRALMKGVKLPLLSIGRATGAAAQFWYDNPAKTPTTRQHITVRAVEELIGAPPGALTRRLRNPPKLRRGPRAQ